MVPLPDGARAGWVSLPRPWDAQHRVGLVDQLLQLALAAALGRVPLSRLTSRLARRSASLPMTSPESEQHGAGDRQHAIDVLAETTTYDRVPR